MGDTDWRSTIKDPKESLVFQALDDPRWDWRTVPSLADASGLSQTDVRKLLNSHPELVRKSGTPSTSGEDLFTLHARYFARKSPLAKGWDFLSSSSSSSSS